MDLVICSAQGTSLCAVKPASSLPSCHSCSASQGQSWGCISQSPPSNKSLRQIQPLTPLHKIQKF